MNEQQDKREQKPEQDPETGKSSLRPWQVISSVFAAGLGVQSSRNRERDFKQGRIGVFIAAGLIFTLLFIATVYGIVQLVLRGHLIHPGLRTPPRQCSGRHAGQPQVQAEHDDTDDCCGRYCVGVTITVLY